MMSLNKFGHRSGIYNPTVPKLTYEFVHTTDGNINIENVKICNLKEPTIDTDASNKGYVDMQDQKLSEHISTLTTRIEDLRDVIQNLQQVNILNDTKINRFLQNQEDRLKLQDIRIGDLSKELFKVKSSINSNI